ncbi:MAG: helix-turn-helix domain-containing protein [bacterium]|nr:helix-turn-helix domain-containing protein [bacterium]
MLLTETQAATLLGVQPATLAAWRSRGGGPIFVRIGSGKKPAVRYRRGDLLAWAADRRHANTAHRIGASEVHVRDT